MPAHGPECVIRVIVKRKGSGGFCRKDEPFSLRRCASRFHKKTSGIRMNHLQKKPVIASPRHRMQARKALADLDDIRLRQLLETARRVERYAVGRTEQSVADALGKPLLFVRAMIAFWKSAGALETKRARAKFLKNYGKKKIRVLYQALEASR